MLRVTTEWTGLPGGPYYTVFHSEGGTAPEAELIHGHVVDLWNAMANYRTSAMAGQVLTEVDSVSIESGEVIGTFPVTPVTLANGTSGARQPVVVQGLVQARTGVYVGGREIRGRTFLPGTLDGSDNDGAPSTAYQTGVAAIFNAFDAAASADNVAPVIYSPTHRQLANVSVYTVWNQWAVLRSRRD